jgi:hypothetical protein
VPLAVEDFVFETSPACDRRRESRVAPDLPPVLPLTEGSTDVPNLCYKGLQLLQALSFAHPSRTPRPRETDLPGTEFVSEIGFDRGCLVCRKNPVVHQDLADLPGEIRAVDSPADEACAVRATEDRIFIPLPQRQ